VEALSPFDEIRTTVSGPFGLSLSKQP